MSENIDIKIREDGSRVVSRTMDNLADKAEKVDKSIKNMNKTLDDTAKSGTSLQRLRGMIQEIDSFNSTMVDRMGRNLSQYRNTLMKHFEMVSREAKASAANLKSQMEALTASPIGMDAMNEYYKNQEKVHSEFIAAAANNLIKQEVLEKESFSKRLAIATKNIADRQILEQTYTGWWAKELGSRDRLEQQGIVDSVRNLKIQEDADAKSAKNRLKYASLIVAERTKKEQDYSAWWSRELQQREEAERNSINTVVQHLQSIEKIEKASNASRLQSAIATINSRKAAEESYTAWWISEIKKREMATAASNLRTAEQRSGMQVINSERLNQQLVKGPNPQSAFYSDSGNGAKTALQTAEVQAMQRQMAMMQLLAPMVQRELDIGKESEAVTKRQIAAKESLLTTKTKLANATRVAGDNQHYWNSQSREAHALARGLSGSLGALWLTYGAILPLLAGAALGSAFIGAAKAGSEMAYQLQFVKSLGGESADAIAKLNEQANKLATTGPYGPVEIAKGYKILAQAGLSAEQSLKAMPNVLNLATVGELDMEQAGLAVVGTLNAFKLGFEQSAHVSDLFAKASAASQASVQDLTQSMKYGSTVGTQYKQNVEETMAALALLAKVNVVGTSAGTAYRNMLKELYTPTKEVTKVWKELGITMEKTIKGPDGKEVQKVKSFVEIINELRTKMNSLNEPSQIKLKGFLGGERGSKEMVAMLDLTKSQWEDFYSKIALESEGFAKKVADDLNATAKNEWKQALNTLEVELAASFKRMEPDFVDFATTLKGIFQSEEFRSALDTIISVTITAGKAFLDLAPIIYNLAKAWLVLKAAQIGTGIADILLRTSTAATNLASGMLAASGAMGPVARGATMLGPLLSALGGPLAIILGLLTAGAAAWLLWGKNSETASGKAIKTAEEKLKTLKDATKYGGGELGKERAELDRLQEIYDLRNKTNGLDRKHVDEAYRAVQVQEQLVSEMEKAQNLALTPPKIDIPKIENPVGKDIWNPPETKKGGKGPSGRLNRDDSALATLKARLDASKQEYEEIQKYGQARFELNEGQKKALEVQEKITALEKMSTSELLEKGIKGREAQLSSLKEQFDVATELGKQLKKNALGRVDTSLQEEGRIVSLLPDKREEENKFLTFRNQLLKEGIPLVEIDLDRLREKVAQQAELNKLMAVRDNVVSNSSMETLKNTNRDAQGIIEATKVPGITEGDKNAATMAKMTSLGLDMSQTTEFLSAQEQQFATMNAQVDLFYQNRLIGEETFRMAKAQIQLKYEQIELNQASQFFNGLSALANSGNRKLAAVGKAAAVTEATISGYVQVSKALASSPPPMNYALAAAAAVSSAMQISKILGVNTNFATGGSFVVGGTGGVDSQQVSLRASPGEKVTVSTPTQVRKGDELNKKNQKQGSSNSEGNNVKIINIVDPNMLQDYLSTPAGERVLVNTIQRNAGAINGVLRG